MSTTSHKTPESLIKQLLDFRRHVVVVKISEVVIAATFAFLVAWWVVLILERFVELSSLLRSVLLLAGAAGFGFALPLALRRWVWGTRHATSVARLLTERFPSLGDEIVGVLELGGQTQCGASDRLISAAMQQTGDDAARQDLTEATPRNRRRMWTLSTAVAVLATLAAAVVTPAAAQNAWQRFLNPWTSIQRFTFTQLAPLPDTRVVPYGESFAIDANLTPDSSHQPEFATASLAGSTIMSQRADALYAFSIPGQSAASRLTVTAGDARESMDIIPMTRPELVDVVARVHLPEYLQIEDAIESKSLSGRFALLAGSRAEFSVTANRELAQATLNQQPLVVNGATATTPLMTITGAETHAVQWQDEHGLAASQAIQLDIRPVDDRRPDCSLQRIEQRVVLHEKTIRLRYSAVDDFGLQLVGIEWQGIADPVDNPNPVSGELILFAGGPTLDSISSESVLSPLREKIPPQVLTLRLFTQDYRPNSERVYSLPQTVHVMSAEQHLQWVTEQMKRWMSKADAVYERELALNEENKALQALPESELGTAENIRRLEQQAAGERDNSQRLQQTVESGRQLVEQALQNEGMNDEQIRRWASSLKRLKDIAGERMPEITRKLTRLASEVKQRAAELERDPQDEELDEQLDDEQGGPSVEKLGQDRKTDKDDPPKPGDEGESSPIHGLVQEEQSMLDQKEDSDDKTSENTDSEDGPKGRMTIPETVLEAPQQKPKKPDEAPQDQEAADKKQPSIDGVVEDQDKLLEEFRKARDAMGDIMGELENSTFVKRLKAASRLQLELASKLNSVMSDLFGTTPGEDGGNHQDLVKQLSEAQTGMFEKLSVIETDLKAYQNREANDARQEILDEMKALNMRVKLEEMPLRLQRKLNGDSLHRAEFWADIFDRWAEELVPPQDSGGGGGGGGEGNPSLPPAIILEVMRVIDEEMQLRDETRSLDQAKGAMDLTEAAERIGGLTIYQMANQERTLDVIDDIGRLPNASQSFEDELKKLNNGVTAMGEASSMLVDGMTGEPTVAAETAALEALMAASRNTPNRQESRDRADGQGDGSESLADVESPFDILKPSDEFGSQMAPRDVGAALGRTSDRVPEAYRSGLDSFRDRLRKLEQMQGRK